MNEAQLYNDLKYIERPPYIDYIIDITSLSPLEDALEDSLSKTNRKRNDNIVMMLALFLFVFDKCLYALSVRLIYELVNQTNV